MKMYANLHTHSTHSDGKFTPTQLVEIAKKEGYKAIALTDHDTVTGYPELQKACADNDMECIFGAEFSAGDDGRYFHIVGFHFDPEHPEMQKYLAKMSEDTVVVTKCCFDEAIEAGTIKGVTWDDVVAYNNGITWLCNEHVFRLLVHKGIEEENNYYNWFKLNYEKQREKYWGRNTYLSSDEIISLIHKAGGIAVLAHPFDCLDVVENLVEKGLDGIEVRHPDMPEDCQTKALELAKKYNLYISGGTDHSGLCSGMYSAFKTQKELEESGFFIPECAFGTTKEYFEQIKSADKKEVK